MNILAVIITYHPNLQRLYQNVESFAHDVNGIMIWDNTEGDNWFEKTDLHKLHPLLIYCSERANRGIAYGLNQAWNYARTHQYDTLLTMDQDSVFENFSIYKQHVFEHWGQHGLSVFGPLTLQLKEATKNIQNMDHVITSGMFVPVSLLDAVGGYCNDFLVDGIDVDLCYHLREKGYHVYRDNQSVLHQIYGEPQSRCIFGVTLHSPGYSPFRLYGIFRNHIIIWQRYHYPQTLLWHIVSLYLFGFVIKGVILIENNKWSKLKAVVKGIHDGLRHKTT